MYLHKNGNICLGFIFFSVSVKHDVNNFISHFEITESRDLALFDFIHKEGNARARARITLAVFSVGTELRSQR